MKLTDIDSSLEFVPNSSGVDVFATDSSDRNIHVILSLGDIARLSGYLERTIENLL